MECKYCGTNFNTHSCPSCGAAAHEPPKPEAGGQQPPSAVQPPLYPGNNGYRYHSSWAAGQRAPARHSPANRPGKTRAMPARFMFYFLLIIFALAVLPRLITAQGDNTTTPNSTAIAAPDAQTEAGDGAQDEMAAGEAQQNTMRETGSPAYQTLTEEEYKATAEFLDFDAVKRNPTQYHGADMYITIEISQMDINDDGAIRYIGYAMYPDGTFPQDLDVRNNRRVIVYDWDGTGERFYKGETILAYGDFIEVEKRETNLAGTVEMPAMNGRYLGLAGTRPDEDHE